MPDGDLKAPDPDAPDPDAPGPAVPDPATPGDDGPRQRLVAGLLKPSKRQLVAGVLLAVLGFAAVTQVHANRTDDTYSGQREQELIDILSALAGTRQRAEDEITDLQRVRDQLRDDTSKRQAALEQAQQDVDELNVLAGQVPVTGPGIRVTIQEETGRVTLSSLLDTIEELRTAQAEAMQINGTVRIVAQTSFEETSGGFLVDGQLVEAPYVLDVIGEPSTLAASLELLLGARQQLEEDGATVHVDQLGSIDIESVAPPEQPDFADPDAG